MEVTEVQAQVFRLWEELGGPPKYSAANAEEIFLQMTPTEQGELPTWPRLKDPKGFLYILPRRFIPKVQF